MPNNRFKYWFLFTLKTYGISLVLSILVFAILLVRRSATIKEIIAFYWEFITSSQGLVLFHVFFLCCLIVGILVRYFRLYKRKTNWTALFKRLFARVLLPLGLLVLLFKGLVYYNSYEDFNYQWDTSIEHTQDVAANRFKTDGKHRGMTVYRIGRDINFPVDSIIKSNIEWVAVLPYFYQEDELTTTISSRIEPGKWTRRDSVYMDGINKLHQHGVRVFLKPHLWVGSGWRSNIKLPTRGHWDTWFESYKKIILHYAQLAEATGVEMLCIGTELRTSITEQPELWSFLITQIRQVYSGKLTYAANWDEELEKVTFWGQLDYIGVQAYFPLTSTNNPSLEQIKTGWQPHIQRLKALAKRYNKTVLFTEVGYKNQANATIRPWEWGSAFTRLHTKKSNKTQQLAFQAMYAELWDKPWFAGSYIWQWVDSPEFAIKGKPAQNTIAKWYAKLGRSLSY